MQPKGQPRRRFLEKQASLSSIRLLRPTKITDNHRSAAQASCREGPPTSRGMACKTHRILNPQSAHRARAPSSRSTDIVVPFDPRVGQSVGHDAEHRTLKQPDGATHPNPWQLALNSSRRGTPTTSRINGKSRRKKSPVVGRRRRRRRRHVVRGGAGVHH